MNVLLFCIGFFCAIQLTWSADFELREHKYFTPKIKCKVLKSRCKIYRLYNDRDDLQLIAKKFQTQKNFKTLKFVDSFLTDFPSEIFPSVSNIEHLYINDLGLIRLELKDLQKFPNLKTLYAYRNNLETLPQDLFDATPNLKLLNFAKNRLSQIDVGSILALKELSSLDLRENICIDEKFDFKNDKQVARASHEIIQSCFPQNYQLQTGKRRCLLGLALAAGMSGGSGKKKKRKKHHNCKKKCKRGKCKWKHCKKKKTP